MVGFVLSGNTRKSQGKMFRFGFFFYDYIHKKEKR